MSHMQFISSITSLEDIIRFGLKGFPRVLALFFSFEYKTVLSFPSIYNVLSSVYRHIVGFKD